MQKNPAIKDWIAENKKMVGIGRFDGEAQPDEPEHCEGNSPREVSNLIFCSGKKW